VSSAQDIASGTSACPACGAPLYGWVVLRPATRGTGAERLLDRCESCGLGIAHDRAAIGFDRGEDGEVSVPNRRSWQAGIGGGHWAALELARADAYPTPAALEPLLGDAGLEPLRVRQPALGPNQLWMWQTLLNAFTFHDDFAVRVLSGRLRPATARSRLTFAIDAAVSIVAALPVALVSLPLELAAVALRRGGLLEAEVRELRA
jgi:hypothetical protein